MINDVHTELTDFYRSMKDGKANDIVSFMNEHPNDEETYYTVRDHTEIKGPLDNAKRFYYLRKTCYRGMLRYSKKGNFNIPFGRYKTCNYEALTDPRYTELLKNTEILNGSFEECFKRYNNPDTFCFLEPLWGASLCEASSIRQ